MTTSVYFDMDIPVKDTLTEREIGMVVRLILAFFQAPSGNIAVTCKINTEGEQHVVVDMLNTSVTH